MKDESSITMNSMHLADIIPTIQELLDSPISNFINLAANDCGFEGKGEDLILNYVDALFLKAKAAASQADNPNWRQAKDGKFAD